MNKFDRSKSVEQLEGVVWPHNDFESHVVQESQRLRKIPVSELSVEGVRLLITQKIGLPFLVPVALEFLAVNPFAEGAFYPGDLLVSVVSVPEQFWLQFPALNSAMVEIGVEVESLHELLTSELLPALRKFHY